jgi:methyltransferase (TIGR00027 family)
VRQIVLLAAGLDSRAYRLEWPAETVVFELDQPQVLEFKREALADFRPKVQRREVAVDLRNDWTQALRHSGFDPALPSAWIAEGLLIYLPAEAQGELFAGIDLLAAPGSRVAIEESVPMGSDAFAAKVEEERAAGAQISERGGPFFQLVYNQQHAPAAEWFGRRGWRADAVTLQEYLRIHGRRVPAADSEAGFMTGKISLISAVKG